VRLAPWIAALVLAGCKPPPSDVLAAIQARDNAELAELLDRGGDPNAVGSFQLASGTYGLTALTAAIQTDNAVALALLLGDHADPNLRDPSMMGSPGDLPLDTAARGNHVAAIYPLILHGARLDGDGGRDETPASLAANGGHVEALAALLAAGAKLEGTGEDGTGYPPLAMAAEAGCVACVQHLLAAGARVDHHDILGITPLHYAVIKNNLAIVDLLLAAKANPMAANRAGMTPATAAQYRDAAPIMERFRKLGVTDFGLQVPPAFPPSGMGTIRVPVVEVQAGGR